MTGAQRATVILSGAKDLREAILQESGRATVILRLFVSRLLRVANAQHEPRPKERGALPVETRVAMSGPTMLKRAAQHN